MCFLFGLDTRVFDGLSWDKQLSSLAVDDSTLYYFKGAYDFLLKKMSVFKKIKKQGFTRTLAYVLYYAIAMHLPYGLRWGPIGKMSDGFRRHLCRRLFKKTGAEFSVGKNVDFDFLGNQITLGERANIGSHAWIRGQGQLILGNDVMMGEFVLIYTQDHKVSGLGYDGYSRGDVVIGNNVWIGGRVTILKGVTIGDNAVVGAASVVTKDIPKGAIVAGNPVRVIKMRTQTGAASSIGIVLPCQ